MVEKVIGGDEKKEDKAGGLGDLGGLAGGLGNLAGGLSSDKKDDDKKEGGGGPALMGTVLDFLK